MVEGGPLSQSDIANKWTHKDQAAEGDNGQDDDVFSQQAIDLPFHLRTRTRRWCSLAAFCVLSTICTGPLQSWATLEPILIKDGVFSHDHPQSQLTAIFSLALGFSVVASLFAGMAYDQLGPRALAVSGALGCAVMLLAMVVCIAYRSLNWGLYVAYPLLTFLGWVNTFGAFAWLWLLPESQNTVNAIAQAVVPCFSDSLVLVIVWLHDAFDVQITTALMVLAGLSLIAAFISHFLVPTKRENLAYASAVVKSNSANEAIAGRGDQYGSFSEGKEFNGAAVELVEGLEKLNEAPLVEDAVGNAPCGEGWRDLKDTCTLIFVLHPRENIMLLVHVLLLYLFVLLPTLEMYPFYRAYFGDVPQNSGIATSLVNSYAAVYGLFGGLAAILIGWGLDIVGLTNMILATQLITTVLVVLLLLQSYAAQLAGQVVLAAVCNICVIIVGRFAMLYGPPELYGTYSGIQNAWLGIGQMLFTPVITTSSKAIFPHSNEAPTRYRAQFLTFGVLSVLSGLAMYGLLKLKKPPKAGSVTMQHIRTASTCYSR